MTMTTPTLNTTPARRSGFALIEAVMSALVIGIMVAAAIELVGASRALQAWVINRTRAYDLAARLMAEITDMSYADPTEPTLVLGREATELLATRAQYDDVDDYHGYGDSPPANRDASAIPGYTGWSRTVSVVWVTSANLGQTSVTETGVKRITVRVLSGTAKLAEMVAIRTSAVNR
jgi:MSHA pilin protein MshD